MPPSWGRPARGRERVCRGTRDLQEGPEDSESRVEELTEDAGVDDVGEAADAADELPTAIEENTGEAEEATDLDARRPRLAQQDRTTSAKSTASEGTEESLRIDLGSLTSACPGPELRLQVAEETGEIVRRCW